MDARVERRRGEAEDDAAGARGCVRGCVGVVECAVSVYSRAQGVGGRGARLRVGSRPRPRRSPSQLRKVATRRLGSLHPRLGCTAVEKTLQLVESLLRTVCCLFASGRLAFSCAGADRGSGRVDPSTSPRRSLPSFCTGHCSPSSCTFALDLDCPSDPRLRHSRSSSSLAASPSRSAINASPPSPTTAPPPRAQTPPRPPALDPQHLQPSIDQSSQSPTPRRRPSPLVRSNSRCLAKHRARASLTLPLLSAPSPSRPSSPSPRRTQARPALRSALHPRPPRPPTHHGQRLPARRLVLLRLRPDAQHDLRRPGALCCHLHRPGRPHHQVPHPLREPLAPSLPLLALPRTDAVPPAHR